MIFLKLFFACFCDKTILLNCLPARFKLLVSSAKLEKTIPQAPMPPNLNPRQPRSQVFKIIFADNKNNMMRYDNKYDWKSSEKY